MTAALMHPVIFADCERHAANTSAIINPNSDEITTVVDIVSFLFLSSRNFLQNIDLSEIGKYLVCALVSLISEIRKPRNMPAT